MLRTSPFPKSIEQLDVELLSDCLGTDIVDFDATRIGADRGMLGEIYLLHLTYPSTPTGPAGPTEIVAKFAALRHGSLASAKRGGAHERELRCFDEFLADTEVNTPRCHGAFYDPHDATFLLLQDAIDNDPTIDQLTGLSLEQARLVLTEAARLHARWWNDPRLAAATWLPPLDGPQRVHNLTTLAATGWPKLTDMLGNELTEAEQRLGAELPERVHAALTELARLPATLLHCDLRADNLLFSPSGDKVTIVDWQGAGTGPPSFDLAYFLTQSLTVEDRRAHEDDLLDFYRDQLAHAGLHLSSSEVRAGYSASLHYGLVIACALPLIADNNEPRVHALAASVARRSIEALRDHDQLWEAAA